MTATADTAISGADERKCVVAAFLLAFLIGPLGLLYASLAGGIIRAITARLAVALTAGPAANLIRLLSMISTAFAAAPSRHNGLPA